MKKLLFSFTTLILSLLFFESVAQNCTVNAGVPQTICANGTLTLSGQTNGSFSGGTPSTTWSQVSGTLTTITSPSNIVTSVTGFSAGTYVYKISTVCLDGSAISDNVTITVRPVPIANAGPDAIYCPGTYALAANAPSPGTGSWSTIGTNYGVTVSTNSSPTSNIVLSPTNSGNTTLRWTISQSTSGTTCTSFDDVIITNRGGVSTVNAGADITLGNCYTSTQSTPLSGSYAGTISGQQGTWTQVSGPNTASFSNAGIHNPTVSNLIQGTYVFRWTVSGVCVNGVDDVQVTVPPPSPLTAVGNLNTQSFCDGRTSTVLTATRPTFAGETAAWTLISGAGTFSTPTNYTTTVNGIADGTNVYRYTITNASGCTSFKDITVNKVSAPTLTINTPSPITLNCNSSSYNNISFTATGGTSTQYRVIAGPAGYTLPTSWSNAGASTFNLTGLTVPGNYLVRVIRNGTSDCSSVTQDIIAIVSQTPTLSNAGTDQLLACNVTTTALAGNVPSIGSGSWSQVSGPSAATIENPSLFNSGIKDLVPGAYNFRWIINAGNGCPQQEDEVTVRVANTAPTTANAGADKSNICHTGPVKLDGNAPVLNEVGTWTVSPSTGITFSSANDPKAIVTGMAANTTYTFTWTIANGCGSSSDDMTISTNGTQGAGLANAGADKCIATSATNFDMTATAASPTGAVGKWTLVSGPNTPTISNVNLATARISGLAQGTYVYEWSLSVSGCGVVSDTVMATISPTLTTANAGSAQIICAASTTLAANTPAVGTGTWTQVSGAGGVTIVNPALNNTTVNGLAPGFYKFRWTISSGVCANSNDVGVTISTPPSTASIGSDATCLTATTLAAMTGNTPTTGFGTWSQVSGPNQAAITNYSSPTSGLSGLINGNYVFRWTISGGSGCAASSADMNVSVNMPTTALSAINVCNITSTTLTGTSNVTGVWSQTAGPTTSTIQTTLPNIGNVSNLQPGSYTFQFTPNPVTGCTAPTSRTVTLTNSAPASASNAGVDQLLCNVTSFSLNGNVPTTGNGAWSRVSGPNTPTISPSNSRTPSITGTVPGFYIYRWTITNGGCNSLDDVTIEISAPVTADAGSNQNICSNSGGTANLNGNVPTTGTGVWSQVNGPATASFSNSTINAPTVSGLAVPGNYTFLWTITNGACTNNSQTVVQVDEAPSANAGSDATVFESSYTLQATQPSVGIGTWSQVNGPASAITNATAYNSKVTGLQKGNVYTYRWSVKNGNVCAVATDDVVLTATTSLPVTLTSFTGNVQNGRTYLNWNVAHEENVNRYEIQRSPNGSAFKTSGTVAAHANNDVYSYQEFFPPDFTNCYYRLKAIDNDGMFEYSPVVLLSTGNQLPSLSIIPNPARGHIVARLVYNRSEEGELLVISFSGQTVLKQKISLIPGSQSILLPTSLQLAPGAYQLVITTSTGVQLKTTAILEHKN